MNRRRNSADLRKRKLSRSVSHAPGQARPNALRPDPTAAQQKQIQDLIDLLKRNHLTELEWECDTFRVRLRHDLEGKPSAGSNHEPMRSAAAAATESPVVPMPAHAGNLVTITSPIVGTFYRSPAPDADSYVEENDFVKKGEVLCIVEAMKLMNEIESEVDGRIVKILAESTKPVEYGQPLFLIEPAGAA